MESIVSRFYPPLYRYALSLSKREAEAVDLTQQTFFILAQRAHQIRDISKVKCWLFTTLRREFLRVTILRGHLFDFRFGYATPEWRWGYHHSDRRSRRIHIYGCLGEFHDFRFGKWRLHSYTLEAKSRVCSPTEFRHFVRG